MICCEICNKAGDECAVTGTPIEWDVFGITIMPDCPERSRRECEDCFDSKECNTCEGRDVEDDGVSDHSENNCNND